MDVIVRWNNYPVNDMIAPMSGHINDLDMAIKTTSIYIVLGWLLQWIVKVDIHITNKINKSGEVAYVIKKVWQLISKHRVSKIVSSVWLRAVQTEKM